MRDSRLFDSVVGSAADFEEAVALGETTHDPWRIRELEEEAERPDPRLGQSLGSIRLESLVGQGGMGTVFEGWDEKLHRKVAVKAVSRRYRSNIAARERFLREARLLSKLQHPNICQIHDHVEGPDGDYLVLELVHGRSLRSILEDGERFSHSDALRIAQQMAAALEAAHDRGVAHRDLKPANIMLTPEGTVKVLDFGLGLSVEHAVEKGTAKAGLQWTDSGSIERPATPELQDPSEEVTVFGGGRRDTRSRLHNGNTSSGSIEGTLAYMSPEQARSEPAGTASDIYSLGLVLQEIFTGRGAYPSDLPATHHLVRAGQGDTLPVEGIDTDLTELIERMKSVAPGTRPSAPDVAERLRWIAGKPARRFRTVALGAFIVLLLAFSAVMAYQRVRIAEEATRANREAESARQVTEYLKGVFEVADPWNAESSEVTARQLLRRGSERIRSELNDQPLIRARLLTTLGDVTRRLGYYGEARPLLEESLALQRELAADPRDLASTLSALALLESDLGDYDLSVAKFQEAIEIQRQHLGPHPELALSILNLGCAEHFRGDMDTALPLYRDALRMFEEVSGPNTLETADALSQLALSNTVIGNYSEAEELHHRSIKIRETLLPPNHPDLGVSYYNLASHYQRQGRYEQALPLFLKDLEISETSLGSDHSDLAFGHRNLASVLATLGRLREAEPHARQALEIQQAAFRQDHPMIPGSLDTLGKVLLDQGRATEALGYFQEAVRMDLEVHGLEDPGTASSLLSLAIGFYDLGRYQEAAESQREALEIRIGAYGPDHMETARARSELGRTLFKAARLDEAARQLRQALVVAEQHATENSGEALAGQDLALVQSRLADVEKRLGNESESEEILSRAASFLESTARTTESIRDDAILVGVLVASGRTQEAEPMARDLLAMGYGRADFVELCREQGWAAG